MKKFGIYLICGFSMFTSAALSAHEVEFDEHIALIPIPAYDRSYGEANGQNALLALNALMETLSASAKARISFDLDARERHQWSNLPARMTPRPGLNLSAMSDEQRALLFRFLSASLGEEGYESVAETMAAEAYLASDSRSSSMQWAPENYWLSIYGEPSNHSRWAWAFGGHHLAINISMDNGTVTSMSPHFVGAEPAQFTINGIEFNAIEDMHQAGYALYQSLDAAQKKIASLSRIPGEVLTGANRDGVVPKPEGIQASDLSEAQQDLLLKTAFEWVSQQPEENSVPSMEQIAAELGQTYFAWVGDIAVTTPTYFRIQGPSVIIELLGGMRTVGNSARALGHYHTIFRNPEMDYGKLN